MRHYHDKKLLVAMCLNDNTHAINHFRMHLNNSGKHMSQQDDAQSANSSRYDNNRDTSNHNVRNHLHVVCFTTNNRIDSNKALTLEFIIAHLSIGVFIEHIYGNRSDIVTETIADLDKGGIRCL